MNSITQRILADQAAVAAKGLQLAAAEAMQRAVIRDSQNRCMALISEFNEALISLKFYTPTGGDRLWSSASYHVFDSESFCTL